MIIIPCRGYDHAIDEVRECHVPLVMADRVDETFPAHTVTTDSHGASVSGTDHLIALGHRRIVFLVNTLDLVNSRDSGLAHAVSILEGVKGVGIMRFAPEDVVRHPLVERIVKAYDADAAKFRD